MPSPPASPSAAMPPAPGLLPSAISRAGRTFKSFASTSSSVTSLIAPNLRHPVAPQPFTYHPTQSTQRGIVACQAVCRGHPVPCNARSAIASATCSDAASLATLGLSRSIASGVLAAPLQHRHVSAAQRRLAALSRQLHVQVQASEATAASTVQQNAQASSSGAAGTTPSTNGNGGKSKGGYKLPPQEIVDIVDAPPQPSLSYAPDRKRILQLQRPPSLPPIYELSRPELKLAGLRIEPDIFARSKMGYYLSMSVVPANEMVPAPPEKCTPIHGYPAGSWLNYVSWSPEGTWVSFTVRSPGGPGDPPRKPLELWVADSKTGQSKRLLESPQLGLNTVFEDYSWLDDNTIVACVLPQNLGAPPSKPPLPLGPKIQDNSRGKVSQNRTYPDLLKDEHDIALFDYYGFSEIVTVDVRTGEFQRIAPSRMYTGVDPSPDGEFLVVSWLEPPYSFTLPCGRFPRRTQLWTRTGQLVRELSYLPLAEDIPIAFNSCRTGPRGLGWRDDQPAELYWIECQDGGDPNVNVSPRDIVYTLPAHSAADPATQPEVLATTDLRCGGVAWCDGDLALVYESWWKTRRSVWWMMSPDNRQAGKKVLYDRNYEDVYSDPGSPVTRRTKWGTYVLAKVEGERKFLMTGAGASPEGNKPFLDLLDLDSKESTRLWQSSAPYYEQLGAVMSDLDEEGPLKLEGLRMMLSRESSREPPQTYIKTFYDRASRSEERQVTCYPHPYPQLKDMQREVIRYPRNDGVMLTATLYLPPGYDKERDGPLPCFVWAYPQEFKSKDAAGQMRRSPYQFTAIGGTSPVLWLTRGYAVLDGPTMPIIAEGDAEPNDTFIEQLTACARAAVEEVVKRGVVDPARVAVGGHSYGAFMAANLLAHASDVFACAVARTGAYNRTLTPFGFQSEERTLWQAADTYMKMSPFMHADKIKKPLLLVHGEDDNNPGTFPIQSERFYQALKGHGAPCRLVLLPHESHGYRARESVMHTLYEQDQWLEQHAGYGRIDPDYVTDGADTENGSSSE